LKFLKAEKSSVSELAESGDAVSELPELAWHVTVAIDEYVKQLLKPMRHEDATGEKTKFDDLDYYSNRFK
jgi:hypothetical protein